VVPTGTTAGSVGGAVTHEYVIGVHGLVEPWLPHDDGPAPTAIAWALDRVLAVGQDPQVRAISRGDSTFLDLGGCTVTPLPRDLEAAEACLEPVAFGDGAPPSVADQLLRAGLLPMEAVLEPGSSADLAFWRTTPRQRGARLVAVVRDGAFTEGDEHRGPFRTA
jgi:hypothetical protein